MDNNYRAFDAKAEVLKAIAHPVRLCILNGLLQKGNCNVSFMQDCLGLPQSTVSQHLQKLRTAGIVEAERNGLEVNYSIKNEKIKQFVELFLEEEQN
ncbi:transcriptional regulator [Paenibacillus oryzae]|uniref:Transcriptional regulator n=1 Tax=Paenibacillus oryzae TaxID=1844972 RepID=A0A1A5YBF2_9BACL|nr:metalloregulator ArsR/SmtB family transcription factor [Paenibacillus oryzae]OBR62934.1 transcriptional regulator [Paenibacillus oryzae]